MCTAPSLRQSRSDCGSRAESGAASPTARSDAPRRSAAGPDMTPCKKPLKDPAPAPAATGSEVGSARAALPD